MFGKSQIGTFTLSLSDYDRVSRVRFEYVYQVQVTDAGSPLQGLTLTGTSNSTATQVITGTLACGDVPAGGETACNDPFIIQHDRRFPFDAAALTFEACATIQGTLACAPVVPNFPP